MEHCFNGLSKHKGILLYVITIYKQLVAGKLITFQHQMKLGRFEYIVQIYL
jgi:hypothetical protein